ncbi:putative histidine kinase [Helianthus annuus]|uniref:histidine kinase n=1 Tax=Helianthus annuus TaxID=4232 RepID=A0A251UH27_HELAN|nr:putative histidine kinase [Helianthus annuus]KAJ0566242.1 putative histidine kinase [Helianthus annuus]
MDDDHVEVLSSKWPENIDEAGRKFSVEKPGVHDDMLDDLVFTEETSIVDFKRLVELTCYSEKGSSQLGYLVKNWEYKQENVARLLREELENLSEQRQVELKNLELSEQRCFEEESYGDDKPPVSVSDEVHEIDGKYDTVTYRKQQALHARKLLEASVHRELILMEKLEESIINLEKQSSPVEELSQILKRDYDFLHFVLQNAPVVIGHQDKELRYRFIYNPFPNLVEEDIIGKTDVEIFKGDGVKEFQDFKREVLDRGLPAKRQITFETDLFGAKSFLYYVEPVFSKDGEIIGVNYLGMDITDQVKKREKMTKHREEIVVPKAEQTELNKTIHITEETNGGDKSHVSVLDEIGEIFQDAPRKRNDVIAEQNHLEVDAEYDTVVYWKQQTSHLGKLLEASVQRVKILKEKLEESIENLGNKSSLVEELSKITKRADKFLHFVLENAPVVIGHQDKELQYRFLYNHFPSLVKEDVIGKTDVEIFKGGGVKESQDFKREVLERGLPAKREITFETELFGPKTFLIYVEPVFSKEGEKIGVNYMGMDVTDQVRICV